MSERLTRPPDPASLAAPTVTDEVGEALEDEFDDAPAEHDGGRSKWLVPAAAAAVAVIGLIAAAVIGLSSTAPSTDELLDRGLIAHVQDDLDSAESAYRELLEREPDNVLGLYNLGVVRQSQRRPAEAAELYRSAIAIDPDLTSAQLNLAWALRDLGQLATAVEQLSELHQRRPDDAQVLLNLGQLLIAAGDVEQGTQTVLEAIELDEGLLVTE